MRWVVFLLALGLSSFATAQTVVVDGTAEEGKPVRIDHGPGVEVRVLFWQNGRPTLLEDSHFVRLDEVTVFAAPVGDYAVIEGKVAIVRITPKGSPDSDTVPDTGPDPNPPPGPDNPTPPDPMPVVNEEGAWVLVIEESAERSKDDAKVLADLGYWNGLKDRGLKWAILDDDSDTGQTYASVIKDVGTPALVVLSKDAKRVLGVQRLPSSTEQIDQVVKEKTGR